MPARRAAATPSLAGRRVPGAGAGLEATRRTGQGPRGPARDRAFPLHRPWVGAGRRRPARRLLGGPLGADEGRGRSEGPSRAGPVEAGGKQDLSLRRHEPHRRRSPGHVRGDADLAGASGRHHEGPAVKRMPHRPAARHRFPALRRDPAFQPTQPIEGGQGGAGFGFGQVASRAGMGRFCVGLREHQAPVWKLDAIEGGQGGRSDYARDRQRKPS